MNLDSLLSFLKDENIVHDITGEGEEYIVNFKVKTYEFKTIFKEGRFETSFMDGFSLDADYNFDMFMHLLRSLTKTVQMIKDAFFKTNNQ